MHISLRARRKGQFEQWPPLYTGAIGALTLLLFLEGIFIVAPHGLFHVSVVLVLWILSYPVIYYGMCRTCTYYGRRCPVPGEGSLVHYFLNRREASPGWSAWTMVGLCYVMRLGYPLICLVRFHTPWWYGVVYGFSIMAFTVVLTRMIGCPYCTRNTCPLNPDYGFTSITDCATNLSSNVTEKGDRA